MDFFEPRTPIGRAICSVPGRIALAVVVMGAVVAILLSSTASWSARVLIVALFSAMTLWYDRVLADAHRKEKARQNASLAGDRLPKDIYGVEEFGLLRTVKMYVDGVARALSVPSSLIVGSSVIGLVLLVLAGAARSTAAGVCATVWGVGIVLVGLRAMRRPARLVKPAIRTSVDIKTSRQAGAFWVFAGFVYLLIGFAAALSQ